jgi:D-glycero-alpha-D-manno-heptose-7-phosphate kinase
MKKIVVRAPVRADLAGGTLDLWPLYLFHPGSRTVNVAISYHATSTIVETGDKAIEIDLTDQQYRRRYETLAELGADQNAQLIFRLVEHFGLTGIRITTHTDAPRGSGLGGSSALAVTLVRALSHMAGNPIEGEDLIALVRDLETRLLRVPAGIQDYYPPVYGGLAALHLEPGKVIRVPLPIPVSDLAPHFLLHYTGIAHFSGTNNWQMYKRQIDGMKKVHRGFEKIAKSAQAMEKALQEGNLKAAGAALALEWKNRKELIKGISNPEIDAAIDAARKAGAWGGKVCGAGGGGCIVFLFPADKREAIVRALAKVPGRTLDAVPVPYGLTIEEPDDNQSSFTFARTRVRARPEDQSLEQLYLNTGNGDYKPFLFAEAIVTHHDGRSGVHQETARCLLAPIDPHDGRVSWSDSKQTTGESLDLRATPDSRRAFDLTASPEALMQGAIQAEEALRQHLTETEKVHVFHNAAFAMTSEAQESRDTFLARCMDEAKRRLAEQSERLESTFRRRMDQLRERSHRENREMADKEPSSSDEQQQDVGVAWGQALYNITTGKPATSDAPQSMREVDYMENIAQIQRAWDKELDSRRDELTAKARDIEESVISSNDIEVTKYLIVWAPEVPA